MVALVRRGKSQRYVARRFGVTLRTVQRWLDRASDQPLASVNWKARAHAPSAVANKTAVVLETRGLRVTQAARDGERPGVRWGASHSRGAPRPVSFPRGAQRADDRAYSPTQRFARLSPPDSSGRSTAGLVSACAAAQQLAEIDCFDVIEDLRMEGFGLFQVFTARALWGPTVSAWPAQVASTSFILDALQDHWRRHGLPAFAQFDNDVRFQGGHNPS